MKRSRLGKSSLAAMLVGLGLAGAAVGSVALAEESTYQPWAGASQQTGQQTADQQLKKLTTDLKTLIKKAETANAADPNFLADLKKLAAQYDGTAGGTFAPGTVFLQDNFTDGNYTANPAWKVSAGTWNVDTGGKNIGLVSKIGQSNKVSGNDVLKSLLGVQQPSQQATYASIYTPATIGNAFKMTMKLTTNTSSGALNIGPYQGASAGTSYRLVYQPGNPDVGMILQRVSGNQVVDIGAYNDPLNLNDGNVHELVWSRAATGKMRVYVDGQQLINITDTKITGNLDGWLNINQGGSYWIRDLKLEAI